jgi:hypothetical protein
VRSLPATRPVIRPSFWAQPVRHRAAWAISGRHLPALNVSLSHGMQEVSGSSPLSSTQFKHYYSNLKPVRARSLRGTLRGKIHRTMGVWPAGTKDRSSLPGEQCLRDVQEVTSRRTAAPERDGRAVCCQTVISCLVPPGSGHDGLPPFGSGPKEISCPRAAETGLGSCWPQQRGRSASTLPCAAGRGCRSRVAAPGSPEQARGRVLGMVVSAAR